MSDGKKKRVGRGVGENFKNSFTLKKLDDHLEGV